MINYLPLFFHYYGMEKIKAGKGYREGRPLGVIGGKCSECDGNIISIKMNTSRKGMEVTSEKVCDTCGLIVPGSFQVLEPKAPYKGKYYETHEQWLEDARATEIGLDDVHAGFENYCHLVGSPNPNADRDTTPKNMYDKNPRLGLAINRLAKTPASIKMDKQLWRIREYHRTADDYGRMLELLPYQIVDVKYIIDHQTDISKWPYKMDDIIYHLCLIMGQKDLRKFNTYNRKLYDLLTDRLGR